MKVFRVFTNDRRSIDGVPMYSALCAQKANTAEEAAAKFSRFGPSKYAPVVAIEWPVTTQQSQEWLDNHVNRKRGVVA